MWVDKGEYHHEEESPENIPHPVEQSRGQTASGDGYSPGWFDLHLAKGESVTVAVSGELQIADCGLQIEAKPAPDDFERTLMNAAEAFVVRRGAGKTVIAGYPWFLDWAAIRYFCARGLLAAGWWRKCGKFC